MINKISFNELGVGHPSNPYNVIPSYMEDTKTIPKERKKALDTTNKVLEDMSIPFAVGLNNTVHNTALLGDMLRHVGTDSLKPFIGSDRAERWHKAIDTDTKSTIASKERLNQNARSNYNFKDTGLLSAAEAVSAAGFATIPAGLVIGKNLTFVIQNR